MPHDDTLQSGVLDVSQELYYIIYNVTIRITLATQLLLNNSSRISTTDKLYNQPL